MIHAFYSDPHFGHENIISYCDRPFANATEMTLRLMERYNKKVGPNDTVLWTGDCFFKGEPSEYTKILRNLHGSKILVMGNHDTSAAAMAKYGFDLVLREAVMNIAGVTCRVNHFPYSPDPTYEVPDKFKALRPLKRPGEVLLHGHTHSRRQVNGRMINLSIDAWDYGPALFAEVEKLVQGIIGVSTRGA